MDDHKPSQMGTTEGITKTIDDTMDQARTTVRDASEQVRTATAKAGTMAQDLVRQARDQVGPTADVLREQGARAGEYLTRNVNDYPLTALMLAGIIGYGLAYLIHSRWS